MRQHLKDMTIIVPEGQWAVVQYDKDDEGGGDQVSVRPIIAFAIWSEAPAGLDSDVAVPITTNGLFQRGDENNFTAFLRPDGRVHLACTATQYGTETFADLDQYRNFCRKARRV
jgi:hypothetical protein